MECEEIYVPPNESIYSTPELLCKVNQASGSRDSGGIS